MSTPYAACEEFYDPRILPLYPGQEHSPTEMPVPTDVPSPTTPCEDEGRLILAGLRVLSGLLLRPLGIVKGLWGFR